jgi:hypothetical protein
MAIDYGFREINILAGNIGYLKLDSFSYESKAYDVAVGAMSFLANSNARITDLRSDGEGSTGMVQLLRSHFLDNPPQTPQFNHLQEKRDIRPILDLHHSPQKAAD